VVQIENFGHATKLLSLSESVSSYEKKKKLANRKQLKGTGGIILEPRARLIGTGMVWERDLWVCFVLFCFCCTGVSTWGLHLEATPPILSC
jgi:hypothetical protein